MYERKENMKKTIKSELVEKACEFATNAHQGQKRKFIGTPYINHALEVMEILNTITNDQDLLAAAVLHDTIEDTHVTKEDIEKEFGVKIASIVVELTNVRQDKNASRETKKTNDAQRLSQVSKEAQTIKFADMISNGKDVHINNPEFAKTYLKEMGDKLKLMNKGDKKLRKRVQKILDDYNFERNS